MGGVAPAESGYYLVQGRGLPRIDVVGFASEVDWPPHRHSTARPRPTPPINPRKLKKNPNK